MTTLGWYVHHHGGGHLGRMLAIVPRLDADVICFSSLDKPADLPPRVRWVRLAGDAHVADGRDPAESDPNASGTLHWAPLQHAGHRSRLATIADAVAQDPLDAFVVDVSVEVALLVRLLGVPLVVIAQPGDRDDAPHALAYRAATLVVAPWPEGPVEAPHLDGLPVVHTGGISRHDGRSREDADSSSDVLLLGGRGGTAVAAEDVAAAVAATPDLRWRILAGDDWTEDPWPALVGARIVVAWAGQNSVADLAVAGARAVVLPQPRPFREQVVTGEALEGAGLAVVRSSWPTPEAWPSLLREASALRPDWSLWRTRGAAGRAAAAILGVAERWPR